MISTSNITPGGGGSGLSKILEPGNHKIKINSIQLDAVPYKAGAYNLVLNVEGPDLGEEFEGFYIDKENPQEGRYKGQVGRVRVSEYPYSDGTTKTGIAVYRDQEILKTLLNICRETNSVEWLESQDNLHDTIESLVLAFNTDKPFKDVWLQSCIAGREYKNREGYINFDLYLPKSSRSNYSYQNLEKFESMSLVITFDPDVHIKKYQEKKIDHDSLGDSTTVTPSVRRDFSLDD